MTRYGCVPILCENPPQAPADYFLAIAKSQYPSSTRFIGLHCDPSHVYFHGLNLSHCVLVYSYAWAFVYGCGGACPLHM